MLIVTPPSHDNKLRSIQVETQVFTASKFPRLTEAFRCREPRVRASDRRLSCTFILVPQFFCSTAIPFPLERVK